MEYTTMYLQAIGDLVGPRKEWRNLYIQMELIPADWHGSTNTISIIRQWLNYWHSAANAVGMLPLEHWSTDLSLITSMWPKNSVHNFHLTPPPVQMQYNKISTNMSLLNFIGKRLKSIWYESSDVNWQEWKVLEKATTQKSIQEFCYNANMRVWWRVVRW